MIEFIDYATSFGGVSYRQIVGKIWKLEVYGAFQIPEGFIHLIGPYYFWRKKK